MLPAREQRGKSCSLKACAYIVTPPQGANMGDLKFIVKDKDAAKEWESLSVAERAKRLDARDIRPALKAQSEAFEKKRKEGKLPKLDIVPSFVSSFKAMRDESKVGTKEEQGVARMCMKTVSTCARQTLSKRDFARFREGIKG